MRARVAMPVLLVAGLAGCAGPFIPAHSQPASAVQPYRHPDFRKLLPGTWAIAGRKPSRSDPLSLHNILERSAQVAAVTQWQQLQFTPSGVLRLIDGNRKTVVLDYHLEGNELHLVDAGPHVEHDRWQLAYEDGALYMRSLEDSEVLTLAAVRQPGVQASSAASAAAAPAAPATHAPTPQ